MTINVKTILITGGATGIGKATSKLFAENGYNVLINYNKSEEKALELEQLLGTSGLNVSIFKSDISKYFDSVNCSFLLKIIKRKIKDKKVLKLIRKIIKSNEKGIPIGNLTSQLFANIYLNEMDQFVKRKLKTKYYFRYMDDFLILDKDKKYLGLIKNKIELFLEQYLDLKFKKKATSIFPISNGIEFLGYRIFTKYMLLKKKTVLKLFKKIRMQPFEKALNAWKAYAKKATANALFKSIFKKKIEEFYLSNPLKRCEKINLDLNYVHDLGFEKRQSKGVA